MPRATLFDVKTGAREAVEIGSPRERQLFSSNWKLETPTQNYQTYQKPQREIFQGADSALVASDTGKQLSPSELSTAVNSGGYQDTRRSLNMQGAPDAAGASMSMATATNPAQSFQDAIGQLLINAQKGANTTDLQAQRNALINARFNSKTATTPEELRMLSPEQQSALRSGDVQGLNTQLAGINTAITGRKEEADSALQFAGDMLDFSLKQQSLNDQEKLDTLDSLKELTGLYGDSWLSVLTDDEKKKLETTLGVTDLSKLELASGEKEYASGIVGEYQFYRDQEMQAGRTPIDFNTYQNIDANRKARASGSGSSSTTSDSKFTSQANTLRDDLAAGKIEWGDAWNQLKNLFPDRSNEAIDSALGTKWKEGGAYEKSKEKNSDKTLTRETDTMRIYSDGSFEYK